MKNYRIKEKIICFVQNSPDEVNSKVAAFIAGMQAQKNLTNRQGKTDDCSFLRKNGVNSPNMKTEFEN